MLISHSGNVTDTDTENGGGENRRSLTEIT